MLSYQHDYHAGNHADVLKHVALTLLIAALERKDSALRVIDTHAGSGVYDLTSPLAQRAREHESGVARVLDAQEPPPEIERYVAAVRAVNPHEGLRMYPGSPRVARSMLRPQDQLELFELHPQAFTALKSHFRGDPQVHAHKREAFEGLLAVLPPPERRGIVLIDPSYEVESDFAGVLDVVRSAARRWANGVFAVWYPLIRKPAARRFADRLRALELPRLFEIELELAGPEAEGLRGSGLVIANLPFEVDRQLQSVMPWLHRHLSSSGAGAWRARWLRETGR